MKLSNSIKELAIITVGNVIVAAAVFFFMLPSHVSVGSGAALAMVLSNFIPLSVSTITLIMNVGAVDHRIPADRPGVWCQNSILFHPDASRYGCV